MSAPTWAEIEAAGAPTWAEIEAAGDAAIALGAIASSNDCVGGGLRSSDDASPEQREAVALYVRLSKERHGYLYGPSLRAYYTS